jgi:hypothetical protein
MTLTEHDQIGRLAQTLTNDVLPTTVHEQDYRAESQYIAQINISPSDRLPTTYPDPVQKQPYIDMVRTELLLFLVVRYMLFYITLDYAAAILGMELDGELPLSLPRHMG